MIGIDVVETKRFVDEKQSFEKMFCESELEYARKSIEPHVHLAGFWAAKEAFFKALGTGITTLGLNKICVLHDKNHKPYLFIDDQTRQKFDLLGKDIEISISHTKQIAVSICIIK